MEGSRMKRGSKLKRITIEKGLEMEGPSVLEFYRGKSVLVTGATGFMGKVLVEKLLWSVPGLERLYIVVRGKKGKSARERWKEVRKNELFDRLHQKKPGLLESKVHVLEGDMAAERLGLSSEDYFQVLQRVSVIFHVAANVRFNDTLSLAIGTNLKSTHQIIELALGMKQLEALVHVSTTFCHSYQDETDERFYPAPADWRRTININDKLNERDITVLQNKYMHGFPNSYIFTKNLSEDLIHDYIDRLPIVVLRPSIVMPTSREPRTGWLDNANGPIGVLTVGGIGLLRVSNVNPETIPDYIAVDTAINAMIIASWEIAVSPSSVNNRIYNLSSPQNGVSWDQITEIGLRWVSPNYPPTTIIWGPTRPFVTFKCTWKIKAIFVHMLPAILIDFVLRFFGRDPIMSLVHKRIHNGLVQLEPFVSRDWKFPNDNFELLKHRVLPVDQDDFDLNYDIRDCEGYYRESAITAARIVLKDPLKDLEANRRNYARMVWLRRIVLTTTYGLLGWTSYTWLCTTCCLNCIGQ